VLDAQSRVLNPYPGKARLSFKTDGTFKLTVFSDLHFGENPWDDWGPKQDVNSLVLMRKILRDEMPDYVYVSFIHLDLIAILNDFCRVINGDLITGESRCPSLLCHKPASDTKKIHSARIRHPSSTR